MSTLSPIAERDLCFIDTETTGVQFGYHEIIDIAAIRTSPDAKTVLGEWKTRLSPQWPERITPGAQKITGFSVAEWALSPTSSPALWAQFVVFVTGAVAVCHNPSFDRAFISLAAADCGITDIGVDYHWLGTESIAWQRARKSGWEKINLAFVASKLGVVPEPDVHRALNGARTCRQVYLALTT